MNPRIRRWGLGVALALGLGIIGLGIWLRSLPSPSLALETSVLVLDRNGRLLRPFTVADGRWRLPIRLQAVDPGFLDMLLAFEDQRFFSHAGVDLRALGRAAVQYLIRGRIVSGGSTLSMQVARLVDGRSTRTVLGKLRQIGLALALERRYGKEAILGAYLHRAPYGGNLEGIRAASLAWFGKEPKRLTPAQAALLVALPQSPEAHRPDRHPQAARRARDRVLKRARAAGLIDAETLASARRETLPRRRHPFPLLAPQATRRARLRDPERGIHRLTLDASLQRRLEALAATRARSLGERLSVALLVADLKTGEVLASVGSAGLRMEVHRRGGFLDMTRALRSPGSTLKPLIYGLAFERGLAHPETLISDRPRSFGQYAPQNFDHRFHGVLTLRQALQTSLNIPAVTLLDVVGPARLFIRLRQAGADSVLPDASPPGLAIGLGGIGLRLTDLVALYGAIARGGRALPLHERLDDPIPSKSRRVLAARAAWYVTSILSGTPATERIPRDAIAVKTGTSYGYRDAWAIGFDGGRVVGVWVGRPDGGSVPGLTGAEAAVPLLSAVFSRLGRHQPLPEPSPGTLLVTNDRLPPSLAHLGGKPRGRKPGPQIAFPPSGARLVLDGEPLTLRVRQGVPPFTWFVNGRPIAREPYTHTLTWTPDDLGFLTLAVVDARGQASRVEILLEREP